MFAISDDTYISLWMEFYQELLPLEAEFADLCPGERVDLGAVLEDEDPEVSHRKIQGDTLMVLG